MRVLRLYFFRLSSTIPTGIPTQYSLGPDGIIGGSFIEPAGFNASPSKEAIQSVLKEKEANKKANKDTFVVEIPKANYVISVAEQAGIGSTYLAQTMGRNLSNDMFKFLDFPYHDYWNPDSGKYKTNTYVHTYIHTYIHAYIHIDSKFIRCPETNKRRIIITLPP